MLPQVIRTIQQGRTLTVAAQQSAVLIVAVIICYLFSYFKLGLYECRAFSTGIIFRFYDLYKNYYFKALPRKLVNSSCTSILLGFKISKQSVLLPILVNLASGLIS